MKESSNRKLWVIGFIACFSLFVELVAVAGMFNNPPASNLHRYAFRWNVVCTVLALLSLGLGATFNGKRLRVAVVLACISITGPLFVFAMMNPSHPVYCFIESYKVSPSGTLGGFALVFLPLAFSATFLWTLFQRFRNTRSLGVTPWPQ